MATNLEQTPDASQPCGTRIDVTDLLDNPGATRRVCCVVDVPEGFDVPLTTFTEPISYEGAVDALLEGIMLRAAISTTVTQQCVSCLVELPPADVSEDVAELFEVVPDTVDPVEVDTGFTIEHNCIDVDPLLRDSLVRIVPTTAHCRTDCAGLCPMCGVNRNDEPCTCDDDYIDDRWAALAELKLDN